MRNSNPVHLKDVAYDKALLDNEGIDKKAYLLPQFGVVEQACHKHGDVEIVDQQRSGVNFKRISQRDKPVNGDCPPPILVVSKGVAWPAETRRQCRLG